MSGAREALLAEAWEALLAEFSRPIGWCPEPWCGCKLLEWSLMRGCLPRVRAVKRVQGLAPRSCVIRVAESQKTLPPAWTPEPPLEPDCVRMKTHELHFVKALICGSPWWYALNIRDMTLYLER